jgi:molybdopterin-guanine dinucleotide biosynthesis protein A
VFEEITAVVLAGGKGSRLGGINKSLIEIDGVPLINRILNVLKPLFREIIIAGWSLPLTLPEGTRSVNDNFKAAGPLAGIEAAMRASTTPWIFVFGGDMPWLSEKIIISQAEAFIKEPADVFVPLTGLMTEPLHAIYSCSLQPSLEAYLKSAPGRAVRDFYQLADTRYFNLPQTEETLRAFTNINTHGDLP